MIFRFNGGTCDQSFNIQESDLFRCIDLNGGAPTTGGIAYIRVTTLEGDTIYFEGRVNVGDEFALNDGGNTVEANMNVTVYAGSTAADALPENIVQTLVYHSSCSQNLFLKDRFGSVQLVVFINEDQGAVSCFLPVSFGYSITNEGDFDSRMVTLIVSRNGEVIDLTDKVEGVIVPVGQVYNVVEQTVIDMTVRLTYTTISIITGETLPTGRRCVGRDTLVFIAGNPLPRGVPSQKPTQAPTTTPVPTPDPLTTPCDIRADISCRASNGVDCRFLQVPTDAQCIATEGGDRTRPTEFVFKYTGLPCDQFAIDEFDCEDDEGGPAGQSEVYVDISKGGTTYFQGVVSVGERITASSGEEFDNDVDIEISTPDQETFLQYLKLSTRCREEDNIILLQNYGALQLTSFTIANQGEVSIEVDITYTFAVENPGKLAMELLTADFSTDLVGSGSILDPSEPAPILVLNDVITSNEYTTSLLLTEPNVYNAVFNVTGQSFNLLGCEDDRTYSFEIFAPP